MALMVLNGKITFLKQKRLLFSKYNKLSDKKQKLNQLLTFVNPQSKTLIFATSFFVILTI